MVTYRIVVIPGDGIGPEVMAEGRKILDAVSEVEGFELDWRISDLGAERYLKTRRLLEEEDLEEMDGSDAIYFGAVGDPRVEPGILEKGIILALRFHYDQYVNLRPCRLLEGVPTPLKGKGPKDIDITFIRENTEDFYISAGGVVARGRRRHTLEVERMLYNVKFGLDIETDADEIAYQLGVISRKGTERVIRYAFEYARARGKDRVASVDKANVLTEMYGLWRRIFREVSGKYSGIRVEFNYVDAFAMRILREPERYQVVVAPNLFGDILTDLAATIQGGLGFAPGGNINPERLSMFEPIHGSAPDIAGRNIANPIATIWAGALMLEELGEMEASRRVLKSMEEIMKEGRVKTPDIGGTSTTQEVGDAITQRIKVVNI
jgi:3-isopropylmalate dehydrogenase